MNDAPPVDASNAKNDVFRDTNGDDPNTPTTNSPEDECAPPFSSAVCDPMCNTDYNLFQRCDVDDAPRTDTCIGIWISKKETSCMKTPTSDPCAAQQSCVADTCQHLCYRDSDCTTTKTCC